jgi:hypothetical protein
MTRPALTISPYPVELDTFSRVCEVSFMEARNLRRKSLAVESLSTPPPPANVQEAGPYTRPLLTSI